MSDNSLTIPFSFSEKSSQFDLFFHGQNGSVVLPPARAVTDIAALSISAWLRYAQPDTVGSCLVLADQR